MVGAVESMVRTDVEAAAPLMLTDAGASPQVTGSTALAGAVVIAQARLTEPVNPLVGAMVSVEVFPVVAPGATVIGALLESVMPGLPATVTVLVVVAVSLPVAAS